MIFEPMVDGEAVCALVYPDDLGLRSKLGGEPDWEQDEEWPMCESCNAPMTFIAQIDSMEHNSERNPHRRDAVGVDQHYMFGDVGMLYVFLCEDCNEGKVEMQCY